MVLGRLRHDPWWLLLQLDRALPGGVRRRVHGLLGVIAGVVGGQWGRVLAVIAANGLGEPAEVERLLRAADGGGRGRAWRALARLATEVEKPHLALTLMEGVAGPHAEGVRARANEGAGNLRAAAAQYERALAHGPDPTIEQRLGRLRDDLRALEPEFTATGRLARPSFEPVPGRVLHLLNNALPQTVAGYTIRAHQTLLAQRAAGLDAIAATKLGYPWAQGHLDADAVDVVEGVSYHHLPFDELREVGTSVHVQRAVDDLMPLLTQLRPAVLHPTTPFDNGQVALALRARCGIPVVYEVRGFLEDTWLSRYPDEAARSDRYEQHRAVEARVASSADHVVTLGAAMRDDLISRGVPGERITVVPNAVDGDAFQLRGRDSQLADALGIDGASVLGYVSSLTPYEGIRYLVEAVAVLRARDQNVVGLVVGDGSDRSNLERLAAELGISEHMRFTGRVRPGDVMRYYELIDVFVVPRTNDRVCRYVTPLKPVEAMAMGRCIVVADIPALAETVRSGETGFTFEAESAESLADVAERLFADPAARQAVGERARAFVVAERSWERNAQVYADIYRSLGAL
jgi:glycosyltransferase involved in cell wall biosynthesis